MNRLRALLRDTAGVTIIEFAIVAPVLLTLIFGVLDLGHGLYMQSVLQGAVQDAGRDAGLESGRTAQATIDESVRTSVQAVMPFIPDEDIDIKRSNYVTFSDIGVPEDYDDTNNNDLYDITECFTDQNGNGQWDDDIGADGLGGADDVVYYEVTVGYDRLFPLWSMIGLQQRATAQATTVMRNQPFGEQAARKTVRICP
ncbi:TadE/TadG family type IV pilus assembly protein [Pelagerythrobacter aerophilus]|uniref:Pilus assembly protein n=1 Tax=Pelagerythrobacter aerophilus TaxID=2306995 RepID=A0A418NJ44_9SPHN|nr:TadE/TadG family type IV pilus assembly protein [Pelagerythrobacter aerophilus]RIV79341.1 pilus assembly protein [Pelagerythrobacter aerophilus]